MLHNTPVPAEILRKWQGIVDLLADIVRVPSALIMRVEPSNIKVLVASESEGNPYEPGEEASLNTGLYCETVMNTRQPLLVPDALQDEDWKSNPDVKLGMISYLGVPISWPDGDIFGTICVLDGQSNGYSDLYLKLLLQWRDVLQADLTSIATSEQRFRTMQAELAHANRLATLGQLTASITHEVKQPLAAVLLNAQAAQRFLARQPPDLEGGKKAMDRAVQDCIRAAEVVDRTRALGRKEAERKDSVEINKAIAEVIGLTRNELLKNSVEVQTQLAEGLPVIQGSRVQLQQVMLNLIVNAIEAMSQTGDDRRDLLISTRSQADCILIAVRDSGPGLPEGAIERAFEAFYTTKSSGLGMGLSICRSIIEDHGGRLWAAANEPNGAAFQFTIPINSAS
jgi:signal transduction histidine kinase